MKLNHFLSAVLLACAVPIASAAPDAADPMAATGKESGNLVDARPQLW